jgi:hypothetical protein
MLGCHLTGIVSAWDESFYILSCCHFMLLHSCHTVTDQQLWLLTCCIVYGNYFILKQVVGTSCQFVSHSPLSTAHICGGITAGSDK